MYRLTVKRRFSAAHHLRDYAGKCAQLHGHNYNVEITVEGDKLDAVGMLIDFGELKAVCDQVLDRYDHAYLNELPEFAQANVTSENLGAIIFERVAELLADFEVRLFEVKLYETEDSAIIYRES